MHYGKSIIQPITQACHLFLDLRIQPPHAEYLLSPLREASKNAILMSIYPKFRHPMVLDTKCSSTETLTVNSQNNDVSKKNYYADYTRSGVAIQKRCLNSGKIDVISMEFFWLAESQTLLSGDSGGTRREVAVFAGYLFLGHLVGFSLDLEEKLRNPIQAVAQSDYLYRKIQIISPPPQPPTPHLQHKRILCV